VEWKSAAIYFCRDRRWTFVIQKPQPPPPEQVYDRHAHSAACPYCHAQDTVKVQTTIRGESVLLEWHCAACKAEWPVRRKDEQASA
jgi:hypothetical protein